MGLVITIPGALILHLCPNVTLLCYSRNRYDINFKKHLSRSKNELQTYPFLHGKKTALFGQKWRISAPGIVINNPKIIDLFSYKFYVGPHKDGFGIVNYNPRRTYCPLVPKQYTLRAAKGSLMSPTK